MLNRGARAVALALLCAGEVAAAPSVAIVVDVTGDPALGRPAHAALVAAVARDGRVAATPVDVGFALGETVPLAAGDAALADAKHQFDDMELDAAVISANRARDVFEAHLGDLAARQTGTTPLRDAQIALAKAKFFAGDIEACKDALRRAFAIDGTLVYSEQLFPRAMRKAVVEARLLFDTIGSGLVEISSEPPGADIAIDGRASGARTPATIEASAGPHEITVSMADRVAAHKRVDVDDKGQKIAATLAMRTGAETDARALTKALPRPDVRACEALARTLDVEALFLVRLTGSGDAYEAVGQLWYATRGHGETGEPVIARGVSPTLERELQTLEKSLVDQLLEHRPGLAVGPTRDHRLKHFRESKAFWYVVGGVAGAVVVGLGIGLGVGLGEAHQREVANSTVLLGGR